MSQKTDGPLSPTKTVHEIDPSKISRAGITTERSLDWEAQTPPPTPAPEPRRDNPDRQQARKKAEDEHQERIASKRTAFRARAEDVKERFQMGSNAKTRRHQYDR